MLGYAAFSWLRVRRSEGNAPPQTRELPPSQPLEQLSAGLEHVPEELALGLGLDLDLDTEPSLDSTPSLDSKPSLDSELVQANDDGVPRHAALGALFLGRASEKLSAFQFGPEWPSQPR